MDAKKDQLANQLFALIAKDNIAEATKLISATDNAKIVQTFGFVLNRVPEKLPNLIKTLFSAFSQTDNNSNRSKRKLLIQNCIDALRRSRLETHVSSAILALLLIEVNRLKGEEIIELLEHYQKVFKKGIDGDTRFVELFPKLLHLLSSFDNVRTVMHGLISGREAKEEYLKTLCDESSWHPSSIVAILIAVKEANLNPGERSKVVANTLKLLAKIDIDEAPAIVYALLGVVASAETFALNGICDIFSRNDKESETPLDSEQLATFRNNQGIIILHLMHAARQNPELGRSLLNVFKSKGDKLLSLFNFAVLLAVSQVGPRMRDQALDLAKGTVTNYLRDVERCSNCDWVRGLLKIEIDLEQLFKQLTGDDAHEAGWEYAMNGLCEFGFSLLESYCPKNFTHEKITIDISSVSYKASHLGKIAVYNCFKQNVATRRNIIQRLLDSIVGSANTNRIASFFFIEVLTALIMRGAQSVLENQQQIVDAFDLLPNLPSDVSVEFLKCILPVVKLSPEIRDSLVMALKKAIFSKSSEIRKFAVGGFLLFLKHFQILSAFQSSQGSSQNFSYSLPSFCSQILCDQNTDPQKAHYERLCLEVIGCLRRTLSQQGDVKMMLYKGFHSVVRRNPSTLQPLVDFLFRQIQVYVEVDEDKMPPFRLADCVAATSKETVTIAEPFGWLLYALCRCLKKAEDDRRKLLADKDSEEIDESRLYFDTATISSVREAVFKLVKRVGDAELEDFALDKSADYSPGYTGETNLHMAHIMLSVYDALIGFVWSFYDFGSDAANSLLKLFEMSKKLKDVLQEKAVTRGKKNAIAGYVGSSSAKNEMTVVGNCLIDLNMLLQLLRHLMFDQSPSRQEGIMPLRENTEFVQYLFNAIAAKVKSLLSSRKTEESKIFTDLCKLSKTLLQFYMENEQIVSSMKRYQLKPLKLVSLEIISSVIELVNTKFSTKTTEAVDIWIGALVTRPETSDVPLENKLTNYSAVFQRHMRDMLDAGATIPVAKVKTEQAEPGDGEKLSKRILMLIRIIELLSKLSNAPTYLQQMCKFFSDVCEQMEIKEAAIAKALWQALFALLKRSQDSRMAKRLSEVLRQRLESVEKDDQEEDPSETMLTSVTTKTAPGVIGVLLSNMDSQKDDCNYMIQRLRRQATMAKDRKDDSWNTDSTVENVVCDQLRLIAEVWHEITTVELSNSCIETSFKMLHSYFDSATSFLRYFTFVYKCKFGEVGIKFVGLMRFIASQLVPAVYKFINYAKCSQNSVNTTNKRQNALLAKRALREMKDVSGLVFAIEVFEKCLIQLDAKCKDKGLTRRMHIGQNRDFRIDYNKLVEVHASAKDNAAEDDDNTENQTEADRQPNLEPAVSATVAKGKKLLKRNVNAENEPMTQKRQRQ